MNIIIRRTLLIVAVLCLAACNNASQQPTPTQGNQSETANAPTAQAQNAASASLVGNWSVQTLSEEGITIDLGQLGQGMILIFNADGTGSLYSVDEYGYEDSDMMQWSQHGNLINIVTMSDGESEDMTIQKLTNNQLIITGAMDGEYVTMSCVRV